jgi:hypothetical protein
LEGEKDFFFFFSKERKKEKGTVPLAAVLPYIFGCKVRMDAESLRAILSYITSCRVRMAGGSSSPCYPAVSCFPLAK